MEVEKTVSVNIPKMGEFSLFFLPLALVAFSTSLVLFLQNVFLGIYSPEALKVAVSVAYLTQALQVTCVQCTKITQAHVARLLGEGKEDLIGAGVWQMIWFSGLSMFVTIPIGLWWGHVYFRELSIAESATPYFCLFLSITFLYSLGSVLSSFFLGIGRIRFVVLSIIGFSALHVVLLYLLIFGVRPFVPSLGLMGGVLSAFLTEAGFCFFLFRYFVSRPYREVYQTFKWRFKLDLFWNCLKTGLSRGLQTLLTWAAWIAVSHLMMAAGDREGYVFAVGTTLHFFSSFIPDGLILAIINRASYLLGTHSYHLIPYLMRNVVFLILCSMGILAIPLLLYPQAVFHELFPKIPLHPADVSMVFSQFLLFFGMRTISSALAGFLMTFQDAKFLFVSGMAAWVLEYGGCFLALKIFHMPPSYFWLLMSGCMFVHVVLRWMRLSFLKRAALRLHTTRIY